MAEENNDANTGQDTDSADSSSDVEFKPIIDDEGLISTVEYESVEKKDAQEVDSDDTDDSDGAEQNTPEDLSEKKPFHEHPRFQELRSERDELRNRVAELEKRSQKPQETQQPEKVNFKNVLDMEDESIVDELTNNPKGFLSNLTQQIYHEIKTGLDADARVKTEQESRRSFEQKATKAFEEFFKDKEDGQAMIQDGRIKQFIAENPGHNAISAYYALAGDDVYKSKIDAAVNEKLEKYKRELKARGKAKSESSAPSGGTYNDDLTPEMKNSSKHGGRNSVLVKRLLNRTG